MDDIESLRQVVEGMRPHEAQRILAARKAVLEVLLRRRADEDKERKLDLREELAEEIEQVIEDLERFRERFLHRNHDVAARHGKGAEVLVSVRDGHARVECATPSVHVHLADFDALGEEGPEGALSDEGVEGTQDEMEHALQAVREEMLAAAVASLAV